jgi:heptosyltransferase-2
MLYLLRRYRPDVVVSNAMSPTFLSSFMAYLSGARIRVGIDRHWRGALNNVRIRDESSHEVELNSRIAQAFTQKDVEAKLGFDYSEEDERIARRMASELFGEGRSGIRVALQPGSGIMQSFKRWEKEKFRLLAEKLLNIGASVVVIGTEEEQDEITFMRKSIKHSNLSFLRIRLTLAQTALFLKHIDIVIANDTSLVHLAAASGIPSVVIYGPTNPEKNEPWGVSSRIVRKDIYCSPCYRYATPHCRRNFECLRDISVVEVFDAVKGIMEEKMSKMSDGDINTLLDE